MAAPAKPLTERAAWKALGRRGAADTCFIRAHPRPGAADHVHEEPGPDGAMLLVIADGTGPMSLEGRWADLGEKALAAVGATASSRTCL